MLGFNSLTNITLCYILSDFTLHAWPPVHFLEILIHLSAAGVNGVQGLVGFLEYQLLELSLVWYTNTLIELDDSLFIFQKS